MLENRVPAHRPVIRQVGLPVLILCSTGEGRDLIMFTHCQGAAPMMVRATAAWPPKIVGLLSNALVALVVGPVSSSHPRLVVDL